MSDECCVLRTNTSIYSARSTRHSALSMQDRPDARELVEAIADFIEREIIPKLDDPRLRFRALIAANVLAIVHRELAAGDAPLRAEWKQLAVLLNQRGLEAPRGDEELKRDIRAMTQELAAQIRAGQVDEESRYRAAFEFVEAMVIEKLKIANPRHLERVLSEER